MLKQNAINVANSGTKGRLDVGGDDEVKKRWLSIQLKIKELDFELYNLIKKGTKNSRRIIERRSCKRNLGFVA